VDYAWRPPRLRLLEAARTEGHDELESNVLTSIVG
jgi:hypothetical protein